MTIPLLTLQSTFRNEIDTINALITGIGGIGAGLNPLPGIIPLASSDAHLSPTWLNQDLPTVSGSANAIQLSFARPYVTVQDGAEIVFIPTATNTGAVTITVDATSAATLTRDGSAPLSSGDLIVGQVFRFKKIGTSYRLVDNANSFGSLNVAGSPVVTLAATQTLTNKTLTNPVIARIVNSGTLTLPTSSDTLVGRATIDTLTNKTLSGVKWIPGTVLAPGLALSTNVAYGFYQPTVLTTAIGMSAPGFLVGSATDASNVMYIGGVFAALFNGQTAPANAAAGLQIFSHGVSASQIVLGNSGPTGAGTGTGSANLTVQSDVSNTASGGSASVLVKTTGPAPASLSVQSSTATTPFITIDRGGGTDTMKLTHNTIGTITTDDWFAVANNTTNIIYRQSGLPELALTPSANDNSTKIASTQYVDRAIVKKDIELFWPSQGNFMYFSQSMLGSDGNVYSCGYHNSKFFGIGDAASIDNFTSWVRVALPFGKKVAMYTSQCQGGIAVCTDNTVWGWGRGDAGAMGDGSTALNYVPTQITGIVGTIQSIWGMRNLYQNSSDSTVVVTTAGRMFAWGYNGRGGFGNGSTANALTPIEIPKQSGFNWKSALTSTQGCFYITDDASGNRLYAAGNNTYGSLGIGSASASTTAMTACKNASGVMTGIKKVLACNFTNNFNSPVTYAISNTGVLYACGYGSSGLMGNGGTVQTNPTFTIVMTGVADIQYAGGTGTQGSVIALKTDGTIYGWGNNADGELGLGDTVQRNSPVQVQVNGNSGGAITGVASLGDGQNDLSHYFLKTDGSMWACGYNGYGHLGVGDTTNRTTFVQMRVPEQIANFYLTQGYGGGDHDIRVYMKSVTGKFYMCGDVNNGQGSVGDWVGGMPTYISTPMLVRAPQG